MLGITPRGHGGVASTNAQRVAVVWGGAALRRHRSLERTFNRGTTVPAECWPNMRHVRGPRTTKPNPTTVQARSNVQPERNHQVRCRGGCLAQRIRVSRPVSGSPSGIRGRCPKNLSRISEGVVGGNKRRRGWNDPAAPGSVWGSSMLELSSPRLSERLTTTSTMSCLASPNCRRQTGGATTEL